MTEIKNISGEVLFSYDESKTTLKEEISKYKDLRGADLFDADLRLASLRNADLRNASLRVADLRWAHLKNADLRGANLSDANLFSADLTGADLSGADLRGTDLSGADLSGARIDNANLSNANLIGANLFGAKFRWADLSGADLDGADFYYADLSNAKNVPEDLPMVCPEEGSFIAWKKVEGRYIIKLEIPEDAKRSSATTKKCRCNKAKVLEITNMFTGEKIDEVVNTIYFPCTYKVDEMVYPDSFDENRWNECSHGIHFFIDREDAENY